jgi:hypothetical protein
MREFNVEMTVNQSWLDKWVVTDEGLENMSTREKVQLWVDIQCAGSGISMQVIEEIK